MEILRDNTSPENTPPLENEAISPNLQLFVLSGGYGTRMRRNTEDTTPKGLAEIEPGKTLLSFPLKLITESGFSSAIICIGYQGHKIKEYFGPQYGSLSLSYTEIEPTGVMDSIKQALSNNHPTSNFGIMWGDEIYDGVSLRDMYRRHTENQAEATVLATTNRDAKRTDTIDFERDEIVTGYCQGSPDGAFASLGVYMFTHTMADTILSINTWEEFLNTLIKKRALQAYLTEGRAWNVNSQIEIESYLRRGRFGEVKILNKGVFSRDSMPSGWSADRDNLEGDMAIINAIKTLLPNVSIIGELSRSSNSITYVLRDAGVTKILQIGPPFGDSLDIDGERQNPRKFETLKERSIHLLHNDAHIPKVEMTGRISDQLGQARGFAITELVKGIPGDRYIEQYPEKITSLYRVFGEELGRLARIPLSPLEVQNDINTLMLTKITKVASVLTEKGILTEDISSKLLAVLKTQLTILGITKPTYVHLDPFPVNLHIQGKIDDFKLVLMDLEAVAPGHPWLEGIGRALEWSGYDWFILMDKNKDQAEAARDNLIEGYNTTTSEELRLPTSEDFLERLIDLAGLVWLPQAIIFELLKKSPSETPERRVNNLKRILEKYS